MSDIPSSDTDQPENSSNTATSNDKMATDGGSGSTSVSTDTNTAGQQPTDAIQPNSDVNADLKAATHQIFTESTSFSDWTYTREQQRNIDDGYGSARNDPSHVPNAKTFSPSQLFSCRRQQYYSARNAPSEESLPQGLFLFGHTFEDLYQKYLEDITDSNTFVKNTVSVDFTEGGARFTGTTDPVITDRTGVPLILTEVKTTKNLYFIRKNGIKRSHKAQAYAYARGLQNEFGLQQPPDIKIIYASRETLEVEQFEIGFDEQFWTEVVEWAQKTAYYEIEDIFPPTVNDDQKYMCSYCEYAERCGGYEPGPKPGVMGGDWDEAPDEYWWNDTIANDMMNRLNDQPVAGFIPRKQYPEAQTIEHLQAHPDVKLTPTIAATHPDLVADGTQPPERLLNTYGVAPQREVHDWMCRLCESDFEFDEFDWDGDIDSTPKCPTCENSEHVSATELRGPTPKQQAEQRHQQ